MSLFQKLSPNMTLQVFVKMDLIELILEKYWQIPKIMFGQEHVKGFLFMIKKGVNQFVEIGPGKVLSGLIKRIDKGIKVSAINTEEDIKLLNIND